MTQRSRLERLYWFFGWAYDFSRLATLLLVVLVIVNYFFFSVMVVRGASMDPTYFDGNVQLINRVVYDTAPPARGDVIALKYPKDPSQQFIKRIIGLPGETVKISDGKVLINGQSLAEPYLDASIVTSPESTEQLAANEYYVMGDNRSVSSDSRAWGPLPRSLIIGKVSSQLLNLAANSTP